MCNKNHAGALVHNFRKQEERFLSRITGDREERRLPVSPKLVVQPGGQRTYIFPDGLRVAVIWDPYPSII